VLQAMAKLSADNVVLMVKLRKAEERVRSLSNECIELRAAVDTQSGSWFEDIQQTVQTRIEDSMKAAHELEAKMVQDRCEHDKVVQRLADDKDQLSAHLSSTLTSCQQLESELQQSKYAPHARQGPRCSLLHYARC
jgi:chromosome segregation ATPase